MIWRCYYARRGTHVHCRLFAGPSEGALGFIGLLAFTVDQFEEFTRVQQVLPINWRAELNHDATQPVYFYPLGGSPRARP